MLVFLGTKNILGFPEVRGTEQKTDLVQAVQNPNEEATNFSETHHLMKHLMGYFFFLLES